MITKENKEQIIKNFRINDQDTGSAQVQVAVLTADIAQITGHLGKFKKDFSSRRGLMKKISIRRRLLNYLKDNNEDAYKSLIKELNLKK